MRSRGLSSTGVCPSAGAGSRRRTLRREPSVYLQRRPSSGRPVGQGRRLHAPGAGSMRAEAPLEPNGRRLPSWPLETRSPRGGNAAGSRSFRAASCLRNRPSTPSRRCSSRRPVQVQLVAVVHAEACRHPAGTGPGCRTAAGSGTATAKARSPCGESPQVPKGCFRGALEIGRSTFARHQSPHVGELYIRARPRLNPKQINALAPRSSSRRCREGLQLPNASGRTAEAESTSNSLQYRKMENSRPCRHATCRYSGAKRRM